MTADKEQERLDGNENKQPQVDEEKKHKSNETKISENLCDGAAAATDNGLIQQRKNGRTDHQQFPIEENEKCDRSPALHMMEGKKNENEKWTSKESVITPTFEKADSLTGGPLQVNVNSCLGKIDQDDGRPAKKTSKEKNKVKKQTNSVDDLDKLTHSSETASEHRELPYSDSKKSKLVIKQLGMDCKDSMSLLKMQDAVFSDERAIELKNNDCELRRKVKKIENKISGLQKGLSEKKEMKRQLQHEKVQWEEEHCDLRFPIKQEKEKRRDTDMPRDKLREPLQRTEELCSEDAAVRRLEVTLRTGDAELRAARDNVDELVEEQSDIQRQLSQEQNAGVLQDGIPTRHLCEIQEELEMAEKKRNDEVSDSHQKDLLHKNHMLQDELAMLRLERDRIKNQFQEKEKKYFKDIGIIQRKNEYLQKMIKWNEETSTKAISQYSGQLNVLTAENTMLNSKLEDEKQNNERLETDIESYRSRLAAAIRDRDQSQTSRRERELAFQRASDERFHIQEKMNFKISVLKDKNEFLSRQISKAESKTDSLEIELHRIRDALRENALVLEGIQRDLSQIQCKMKEIEYLYQNEQSKVNKCTGNQESVEERLSQLQRENCFLRQQLNEARNKADHEAKIVINFQCQCCDTVRTLQVQSEKSSLILEKRSEEYINECNDLEENLHQHENEEKIEVAVRPVQHKMADTLKKPMSEASLEVTSCYHINSENETQDLKKVCQIRSQVDDLRAQLEATSSECLRLDEKSQFQQELLSMKAGLKKWEELEKEKKKLEQEVVNLISHMEMNMVERSEVEQYERELKERARQEILKKLEEVNLFLQEQAASQEYLEMLREGDQDLIKHQMELRIKDLEFELFKMKNSQDDSRETELVKYKQLYKEAREARISVSNKLCK
ncbi:ankyrin repeat domain-containing protein 26-like [Cynocephalus volans]|uniref:ankyrin repeat domain-containing protein 26-like n=1 Tax=Cynocephalus volans TaxID=110931 RepID=UPI002FCC0707